MWINFPHSFRIRIINVKEPFPLWFSWYSLPINVLYLPLAWKWYFWQWTVVCLFVLIFLLLVPSLSNPNDKKSTEKREDYSYRSFGKLISLWRCSQSFRIFPGSGVRDLLPLNMVWDTEQQCQVLNLNVTKYPFFSPLLLLTRFTPWTFLSYIKYLVYSLALWSVFPTESFLMQSVSNYVALKDK